MMTIRRASDRGHTDFGWLDSRHTFSFGDYHDPAHMGVSNLRVINDDRVAPGGGFATHGHRDMEIVSYVLSGALEHRDDMGNGSVVRPGDVQRLSAGTGVLHSEFNASDSEPVRFLQIWLRPNRTGTEPGYEQRHFTESDRRGRLRLLVSPDGRDQSVGAAQDAFLYGTLLDSGQVVEQSLYRGRRGFVHFARGRARVNDVALNEGDGARFDETTGIRIEALDDAEVLLFDLP
jgi:redox-sensitive bicupin YhaK (pirin superfamily)